MATENNKVTNKLDNLREEFNDFKVSQTKETANFAKDSLSYVNEACRYSKKTINWFLIILGIVAVIIGIFGWTSYKEVMSDIDEMIADVRKQAMEDVQKEAEKVLQETDFISYHSQHAKVEYFGGIWEGVQTGGFDAQKQIDILESITEMFPNDAWAFNRKARAYKYLGNTSKCEENKKLAIQLDDFWGKGIGSCSSDDL